VKPDFTMRTGEGGECKMTTAELVEVGGGQSMSLRRVQRGPKAQQAASELRKTALANGEDVIKTTGLKTAIQDCRSPKVRVGGGACRERRMVRNTSERSPGNPKLDPASALVPWAPDLWR
jgi:hypothetical protein